MFDGVEKPFPQFALVLAAEHLLVISVLRDSELDVAEFRDKGVAAYLIAALRHEEVTLAWFERLVVVPKYQACTE